MCPQRLFRGTLPRFGPIWTSRAGVLRTDVLNSIPPFLVQRILDFPFFKIFIFFRVLTPLKKAKILPKFKPRKNGFLALLEEEFSENLPSKVVAIEVSFPRSPQRARLDQKIWSYSKKPIMCPQRRFRGTLQQFRAHLDIPGGSFVDGCP